ncbi:uncharacterized protein L3040_000541 [Drepanopeziza brunnea f. sp. 'multigermtubi']|uniref:uncharacterized protein n=1 Tax=Drepanopeziza brunnea f. sp. 'multigermtubi' TaxID=698441 RepID=UPI00239871AA|nr:hypothetical protein L3040_000541 [Drepanopeziza brunnea f. sp. 'multigermtubi']
MTVVGRGQKASRAFPNRREKQRNKCRKAEARTRLEEEVHRSSNSNARGLTMERKQRAGNAGMGKLEMEDGDERLKGRRAGTQTQGEEDWANDDEALGDAANALASEKVRDSRTPDPEAKSSCDTTVTGPMIIQEPIIASRSDQDAEEEEEEDEPTEMPDLELVNTEKKTEIIPHQDASDRSRAKLLASPQPSSKVHLVASRIQAVRATSGIILEEGPIFKASPRGSKLASAALFAHLSPPQKASFLALHGERVSYFLQNREEESLITDITGRESNGSDLAVAQSGDGGSDGYASELASGLDHDCKLNASRGLTSGSHIDDDVLEGEESESKREREIGAQGIRSNSGAEVGVSGPAGGQETDSSRNIALAPLPAGLQFEIRPSSPGRGLGAFALANVASGTEILVEQAAIPPSEYAWILDEAYFAALSPDRKQRLLALLPQPTTTPPCGDSDMARIMEASGFECNDGFAVYEVAARFNHDCRPNVRRGFTKENCIAFVTAREITRGEELTISYLNMAGMSVARRKELTRWWGFECKCDACVNKVTISRAEISAAYLGDDYRCRGLVVGKLTERELQARADVEAWWEDVHGSIEVAFAPYYHTLNVNKRRKGRFETTSQRAVMVEELAQEVLRAIKEKNQFRLDDTIIDAKLLDIAHWVDLNLENYVKELKLPKALRNLKVRIE